MNDVDFQSDQIEPGDKLGQREDGKWEKIQPGKKYLAIGEARGSPIIEHDSAWVPLTRDKEALGGTQG